MFVISRPNAFITTALAALIVGFFLGAHAVLNSNATAFTMLVCIAIGAALGYAVARRAPRIASLRNTTPYCRNREPPIVGPSNDVIDDAQSALVSLGFTVREARVAVASTLTTLGDDATVSTIVHAALRARGS
jgi:hypothetical protein